MRHALDDLKSMDNVSVCLVKFLPPGDHHHHPLRTLDDVRDHDHDAHPADAAGGGGRRDSGLAPPPARPPAGAFGPFGTGTGTAAAALAPSTRAAPSTRREADTDDDLMDYLLDDRNFA